MRHDWPCSDYLQPDCELDCDCACHKAWAWPYAVALVVCLAAVFVVIR
jgi:hypothetical protein